MINASVFKNTVKKLGESITFNDTGITVKAALKYSTSAVFNFANRAYYVEGQIVKSKPMFNVGDYFTRKCDSKTYFVSTIQPDSLTNDLVYSFGIQCNATITVTRNLGKITDEDGNLVDNWITVCENTPVYRDFTTRSGKQTNDGLMDQGIYTMIVPHKLLLSAKDRVIMKYNENGIYTDTDFFVENLNCSLSDDLYGIDSIQLSRDIRDT